MPLDSERTTVEYHYVSKHYFADDRRDPRLLGASAAAKGAYYTTRNLWWENRWPVCTETLASWARLWGCLSEQEAAEILEEMESVRLVNVTRHTNGIRESSETFRRSSEKISISPASFHRTSEPIFKKESDRRRKAKLKEDNTLGHGEGDGGGDDPGGVPETVREPSEGGGHHYKPPNQGNQVSQENQTTQRSQGTPVTERLPSTPPQAEIQKTHHPYAGSGGPGEAGEGTGGGVGRRQGGGVGGDGLGGGGGVRTDHGGSADGAGGRSVDANSHAEQADPGRAGEANGVPEPGLCGSSGPRVPCDLERLYKASVRYRGRFGCRASPETVYRHFLEAVQGGRVADDVLVACIETMPPESIDEDGAPWAFVRAVEVWQVAVDYQTDVNISRMLQFVQRYKARSCCKASKHKLLEYFCRQQQAGGGIDRWAEVLDYLPEGFGMGETAASPQRAAKAGRGMTHWHFVKYAEAWVRPRDRGAG
jgi:hypothetical protein